MAKLATIDTSARKPLKKRALRIALLTGGLLAGAGVAGWAGLQVQPHAMHSEQEPAASLPMMPLPPTLPSPVERFYRAVYGTEVPVIASAEITGRGTMRIAGITLPVRLRFTHQVGFSYHHEIEVTWFRLPVFTVNEHYVDGVAVLELPFGTSRGANIDQAANLTLWAEAVWMPAIWLTDVQVRWEAIDDRTALLIVPFGETEQQFTVFFAEDSGLIQRIESMRYQAADSAEPTLWINIIRSWELVDGWLLPKETAISWDHDTPWAELQTDSVIYFQPADVTHPE